LSKSNKDISTCAYCNRFGKFTREHIFPICLIKKVPNYTAKYSLKAKKVFGAELIVKDVCAICNNDFLGKLDEYICKLYDEYFSLFVDANDKVVFKYDYNKLLRWLLKISYNSGRTTNQDIDLLSKYKNYILYGGDYPEDVAIFIDLIPPAFDDSNTKIYPKSMRCGKIKTTYFNYDWLTIRVVAINSFYFYLAFFPIFEDSIPKDEFNLFGNKFPGILLNFNKNLDTLFVSKQTDSYEIHKDHLTENQAIYDHYFNIKKSQI